MSARSPSPTRKVPVRKNAAAIKKAEAKRRREEELRRQEEAANEAAELQRMAAADEESRKSEAELAYRLSEQARRTQEADDVSEFEKEHGESLAEWEGKRRADSEWHKYLNSWGKINPLVEAEVNTWLTVWDDKTDYTLPVTIQDCQDAEDIVADIEKIIADAEQRNDPNFPKLVARLRDNIKTLRDMELARLDRSTAHVVQHADLYINAKNEVLLSFSTPDVKVGLWVNLTKSPRPRTLEFGETGLTVDISKFMALANVAMRLIHLTFDHMSDENNEYISLGGVVFLDILVLPPPPKRVKGWTLRQVTPLSTNISRLGYPLAHTAGVNLADITSTGAGDTSTWPPVRITYVLPPNVSVRQDPPIIGWWDSESSSWKIEGITNVEFNKETRVVTFCTMHAAPHTMLQFKHIDFPLSNWNVTSVARNLAVLSLSTRVMKQVQIEIGEGYCRLVQPHGDELHFLNTSRSFSAGLLLQRLAESGINLLCTDQIAKDIEDQVKQKDQALELRVCRQIALLLGGFSFSSSSIVHNNQDAPPTEVIFKVRPNTSSQSQWRSCSIAEGVGCRLLPDGGVSGSSLNSSTSVMKASTGDELTVNEPTDVNAPHNFHAHLFHCVAKLDPSSRATVQSSSPSFVETALSLLTLLRPFSSTQ